MAFSFDSSEVNDDLIKAGEYNFLISKAVEGATKNGDLMLCFEFTICDGLFEGRKVFENFLVGHPKCADIAKRSMKVLSFACDLPKWDHVSELSGKFVHAELIHKKDSLGIEKDKLIKFKPYVSVNLDNLMGDSSDKLDIPF